VHNRTAWILIAYCAGNFAAGDVIAHRVEKAARFLVLVLATAKLDVPNMSLGSAHALIFAGQVRVLNH
jgi:hypothetical protein